MGESKDAAQENWERLAAGKEELSSIQEHDARDQARAMAAAAPAPELTDPREPARTQEEQENPPAPPVDEPAQTQPEPH